MTRISIAMATYNGELFLQQQLSSLMQQEVLPFELIVCDDGSTDSTLDILYNFKNQSPFPTHIVRNACNLGYANNFFKAAKLCQGDWVSFCDQDDFWLPSKIRNTKDAIEDNDNLSMILQYAYICDEKLEHGGKIFPYYGKPGIFGPNRHYGFWVWPGFLKTFRSSLLQQICTDRRPLNYFGDQTYQTHDKWTCMIANCIGGIAILEEPAALYRRHERALTGYYNRKRTSLWTEIKKVPNFLHLVKSAESSSEYLREVAVKIDDPLLKDRFYQSAILFERLAQLQRDRSSIYCSRNSILALWKVVQFAMRGGYLGHPFLANGSRSFLKDILFGLTLTPFLKGK